MGKEVMEMTGTAVNDETPMLNTGGSRENSRSGTPRTARSETRVDMPDNGPPEAGSTGRVGNSDLSLEREDWRHSVDDIRVVGRNNRERYRAFNHNRYATRKTAAQGMMDMALMLANASQLKSVVQEGPNHQHYVLLISLISLSIGLQVFTGFVLLLVGARESKNEDHEEQKNEKTNKLNNFSIALVFLITMTNIFITSFGIHGNTSTNFVQGSSSGSLSGDSAFGTGSGSIGGK